MVLGSMYTVLRQIKGQEGVTVDTSETGGLFRIAVKLMMARSASDV
jgi:hypothetical protein